MTLRYRHSILLLDDEKPITSALGRLFHREKYNILTASSGAEALGIIKNSEKPISLVISDQRMPGMDGSSFLAHAKEISPHTIRFLLTGYTDMDALAEAVNKGEIHRYITKPWNDSDLLLLVRQSLEQYELTLENRRLLALLKRQNGKLKELNLGLEQKVEGVFRARDEEIGAEEGFDGAAFAVVHGDGEAAGLLDGFEQPAVVGAVAERDGVAGFVAQHVFHFADVLFAGLQADELHGDVAQFLGGGAEGVGGEHMDIEQLGNRHQAPLNFARDLAAEGVRPRIIADQAAQLDLADAGDIEIDAGFHRAPNASVADRTVG